MDYIEVSLQITPYSDDSADIIMAEIEPLGFESFLNEEPFLKGYIPQEKFSEPHLKTVLSAFIGSDIAVSYTLNLIKEENWNVVWESSFEPVVIDKLCTIKATFHKGLPRTKYTITINPEMAFGTGHHQTTTLMVEALLSLHSLTDKQVLDMGCGTGILSILAAKMKALSPVHAIDIDPIAVRSARENATRNRVGDRIRTLCGDASLIQANKYDIILANINRNILLEDMSTYCRGLKPGGLLLISGFYRQDIPMLTAEARRLGLDFVESRQKENWSMVKFAK